MRTIKRRVGTQRRFGDRLGQTSSFQQIQLPAQKIQSETVSSHTAATPVSKTLAVPISISTLVTYMLP